MGIVPAKAREKVNEKVTLHEMIEIRKKILKFHGMPIALTPVEFDRAVY